MVKNDTQRAESLISYLNHQAKVFEGQLKRVEKAKYKNVAYEYLLKNESELGRMAYLLQLVEERLGSIMQSIPQEAYLTPEEKEARDKVWRVKSLERQIGVQQQTLANLRKQLKEAELSQNIVERVTTQEDKASETSQPAKLNENMASLEATNSNSNENIAEN